ncbi:hypothetical protein ABZ502_17700 [Streptomyces abikoensis]|uniref:hypothetical protein n=1 Tax=Streptomyces abikoensis TaxID=97398 RepID=UPI0033EEFF5E
MPRIPRPRLRFRRTRRAGPGTCDTVTHFPPCTAEPTVPAAPAHRPLPQPDHHEVALRQQLLTLLGEAATPTVTEAAGVATP